MISKWISAIALFLSISALADEVMVLDKNSKTLYRVIAANPAQLEVYKDKNRFIPVKSEEVPAVEAIPEHHRKIDAGIIVEMDESERIVADAARLEALKAEKIGWIEMELGKALDMTPAKLAGAALGKAQDRAVIQPIVDAHDAAVAAVKSAQTEEELKALEAAK